MATWSCCRHAVNNGQVSKHRHRRLLRERPFARVFFRIYILKEEAYCYAASPRCNSAKLSSQPPRSESPEIALPSFASVQRVPWLPLDNARAARLINDIVIGEETRASPGKIPELGGYRERPEAQDFSLNNGWPLGFLRNYVNPAKRINATVIGGRSSTSIPLCARYSPNPAAMWE